MPEQLVYVHISCLESEHTPPASALGSRHAQSQETQNKEMGVMVPLTTAIDHRFFRFSCQLSLLARQHIPVHPQKEMCKKIWLACMLLSY